MGEPVTTALVSELMPKLYAAFPRTIKGEQGVVLDTYRNGLRGLSGEAVRFAVDRVIQEDTYFPKVSRLRELATAWQRRNATVPAVVVAPRWDTCPVCGATAKPRTISRQRRDPDRRNAVIRDERGQVVWEEVESLMLYLDHDPARHHVSQRAEGDLG